MHLRGYQSDLIADVRDAWEQGSRNVMAVLPTGGGKTVCFGTILREHNGASCAIAHRSELVGQMSTTLAKLQVRHRIIAPVGTIRDVVTRHMHETGRSWHDPMALAAVAGVDTLTKRELGSWAEQVTLWVTDEGHHLLSTNKWGKGVAAFPNARGLAVTATPLRADGRGLGRGSDGMIDYLIQGPTMRELIDAGYLTDYRIFAPASDLNLANVPVSDATGDFNAPALRDAAKKSHVTGDIVENYLKIARGKLGVTFCVSVDLAGETAARYRAAGVPAEMVSANTPELERAAILRKFARRELLQLVNVDLFGEGFDLPAIEVVSMGRPTASYGLYVQQFGRACRPMEGKDRAMIIDHVGNVLRHGLPDAPRIWTLDRRERRARNKEELLQPVRVCPECTIVYEKFRLACPHCGHIPVPKSRAAPEHVDGDITELDPAVLARLRRESDVDVAPKVPYGATDAIRGAIMKRHRVWKETQRGLRAEMALYGGWQKHLGRPLREAYKRFFIEFGVDVVTAQGLPTNEATELTARIAALLNENRVVPA